MISSVSRTIIRRLLDQNKIIIFVLEALLLTVHHFIPSHFLAIRLFVGIICYVFIPGYLLVKILGINRRFEETFGLGLLFGFSVQILIIALFWSFLIEPVNQRLMSYGTIAFVFIMLLKHSGNSQFKLRKGHLFSLVFLILILAVLVRSYYFFFNVSSLGIDGGLYCDFARTIASNGRFSSSIVNDGYLDPYFNVKGFTSRPLTVFSIATFFFIGDVSYTSAKLAVLFVGVLLVFLIYRISNELFGKEIALIAGLISAFFPLLSYYSSILHGPEILGTLFILASIYFFLLGIKNDECKIRYMALSGLFAAMTHGAWEIHAFVQLIVTLTFVFLMFKIQDKKLCLYALSLIVVLFFAYKLSAIPFIQLPLATIPFICLSVLYKKRKNLAYFGVTLFAVTVILSLQLLFMRSYLAPEMYVIPSTRAFMENPGKVVNPFSLTYGIHTDIDYVLKTLGRFWQSIATILTPLIFGLAIASFISPIKLKEKIAMVIFPFIGSILLLVSLPEYVAWFGNTFPDRFLISPICFLIILSAVTINTLLNASRKFRCLVSIAGREIKVDLKKFEIKKIFLILTFIVVVCSLIPVHTGYLSNFNAGYTNVLEWYGTPAIKWIENNSSSDAVFLAADVRRLAWFTDRTFVGMTTESGKLDISELNSLIQSFNVSYVVVDDFLIRYTAYSDFFYDLYRKPLSLEQVHPIVDKDTVNKILSDLVESNKWNYAEDFYGLKLVFESSQDSRITRIFRVVKVSYILNVGFMDNTFIRGWVPRVGGSFHSDGEIAKVSTSDKVEWSYIYMNRTVIIDTVEFSYMAVKVRGDGNSSTRFWIALIDFDGTWHKVQEDARAPAQFQLYVYDIGTKVGNKIMNIYLGVSGGNQNRVDYDWIIIYNLVAKEATNGS